MSGMEFGKVSFSQISYQVYVVETRWVPRRLYITFIARFYRERTDDFCIVSRPTEDHASVPQNR